MARRPSFLSKLDQGQLETRTWLWVFDLILPPCFCFVGSCGCESCDRSGGGLVGGTLSNNAEAHIHQPISS